MAFLIIYFSFSASRAFALDSWETITPPGASGYSFKNISAMNDYVYLGTNQGLFKSSDKGATWSPANNGLSNLVINSVAIGFTYDSADSRYEISSASPVFVGTASGLFSGTIGGTSWNKIGSVGNISVFDVEFDQAGATQGNLNYIYLATSEGVWRSDDGGNTFYPKSSGLSGSVSKITSDFGNGAIYAISNNKIYTSPLFSSSLEDETWTVIYDGGSSIIFKDVSILNPIGGVYWIPTSGGILKSDYLGRGWAYVNNGLEGGAGESVASDWSDGNITYSAINGKGVYRTTAEASESPAWKPINKNLSNLNIIEVKTNPGNSGLVYAIGGNGAYRLSLSRTTAPYIDLTSPSAISDFRAPAGGSSESTITLNWTGPGDDASAGRPEAYSIRYDTYPITESNFNLVPEVLGQTTPEYAGKAESFTAKYLLAGTRYYFAIKARDKDGNWGPISNIISAVTSGGSAPPPADTQAPSTPQNVRGSASSGSQITLSWNASSDNTGVAGYNIYRNGSFAGTVGSVSFTDSNLSAGVNYSYSVKAYDSAGNYSAMSSSASVSTPASPSTYPACSSFTYSSWSGCAGGNQTRTILASSPSGCTGGSPQTSQSCANTTPPPASNQPTNTANTSGTGGAGNQAIEGGGSAANNFSGITASSTTSGETPAGEKSGESALQFPSLTKNLNEGGRGEEVGTLQRFLKAEGFLKIDQPTNFLGPATSRAVGDFQIKYKITTYGKSYETGYGAVGTKTRSKINEIIAKKYPSSTGGKKILSPAEKAALIAQIKAKILELQVLLLQMLVEEAKVKR